MNAQLSLPLARNSDPSTSGLAAAAVRPGAQEHEDLITAILLREGPLTHEQIARHVQAAKPDRWQPGSTVTACARMHLYQWGETFNSRGRPVKVWFLVAPEVEVVKVTGDSL